MAINTDISDLAWLTQPADPGGSFAKGVASGSQLVQNYIQGAGLAQRQMEMEQRLKLAPLEMTIQQQNADLNALRIQNGLQARQNYLEASKAFTGLADAVNGNLQEGNLDEAILAFTQGGLSNNALLTDPRYQALGKQLDAMQQEADLAEYRKGTVEARMAAADQSSFRALPTSAKLKQLADKAYAEGDTEMGDFYTEKLGLEEQKLKTEQDRIAAENRRTDATNQRTALSAPQQARLKSIYKEIDRKKEERDALPEMSGFFSKSPNPKRAALQKRIDELEAEAERLAPSAPAAVPTTGATIPTPPASVPPSGERIIVIDRRPNSPTFGKEFYVDSVDQERAVREGYEVK